jgi:hypothetical protein
MVYLTLNVKTEVIIPDITLHTLLITMLEQIPALPPVLHPPV